MKCLTTNTVLQPENINSCTSIGIRQHCWSTLKQDNESPPASRLPFWNLTRWPPCGKYFPMNAPMKQYSTVCVFKSGIKHDYTSHCLFRHDFVKWSLFRDVRRNEFWSHSRHRPPRTVSVKIRASHSVLASSFFVHLNYKSSLIFIHPLLFFQTRSTHPFLRARRAPPHSSLSFSNSISFNSGVQFSARASAISYRSYLRYLQLSHQAR